MTTESWARLSSDAFNLALFAYIAAMIVSFAYLAFRKERLHTVATVIGRLLGSTTTRFARTSPFYWEPFSVV